MATISSGKPRFDAEFPFEIPSSVLEMADRLKVSSIRVEPLTFPAKLDLKKKIITIDSRSDSSEAINGLIFELHNLSSRDQFVALFKSIHNISVDEYVMKKELIEYNNIKDSREMIRDIGVDDKLSRMDYDFDVHYLIQQASGHSSHIVNEYAKATKKIPDYRGTWYYPIATKEERVSLFDSLLNLKYNSGNMRGVLRSVMERSRKTFDQLTKTAAIRKLFPEISDHFSNLRIDLIYSDLQKAERESTFASQARVASGSS